MRQKEEKEADRSSKVSEERERELLSLGASSDILSDSAETYRRRLQEESLEGLPDHMKFLYIATDYLGITSPDKRLAERIKKSDQSCIKQRVLISQYDKRIRSHEQLISEKEAEMRDCIICFEKRKADIEEAVMRIERLEEEKQEQEGRLRRNPSDKDAADAAARIDSDMISANQGLRRNEREKNEFAARIIEAESFVNEAQNVLVSVQVYSSALQKNYLKSRIERMRLAPVASIGKKPIETIDVLVQDSKIAEETGRLADAMTSWISEITELISDMQISPRQGNGTYSDLKKRYEASSNDISSIAEKIIEDKRKAKYT